MIPFCILIDILTRRRPVTDVHMHASDFDVEKGVLSREQIISWAILSISYWCILLVVCGTTCHLHVLFLAYATIYYTLTLLPESKLGHIYLRSVPATSVARGNSITKHSHIMSVPIETQPTPNHPRGRDHTSESKADTVNQLRYV